MPADDFITDEVVERAICAAARERRWDLIDLISGQYGRYLAARAELQPLLWDHMPKDDQRAWNEAREVDALCERWEALEREIPAEGELTDDLLRDAFERAFTLLRDVNSMARALKTTSAVERVTELHGRIAAYLGKNEENVT